MLLLNTNEKKNDITVKCTHTNTHARARARTHARARTNTHQHRTTRRSTTVQHIFADAAPLRNMTLLSVYLVIDINIITY